MINQNISISSRLYKKIRFLVERENPALCHSLKCCKMTSKLKLQEKMGHNGPGIAHLDIKLREKEQVIIETINNSRYKI
jgi:hypothetical protein